MIVGTMQGNHNPKVNSLVATHQEGRNFREIVATNGSKNSENFDFKYSDYAVSIQNLGKTYDKNGPSIVNNLCMNVKKGTIYGLLGSSGCGKTTVLSCIVGLKKWDSGDVLVFGKEPGSKESGIPGKRVGYMPQDLALYSQLSIKENIQFYGRIYNMTHVQVKERHKFIRELLKLPSNSKFICDLSGGQKRRASLALALLHSPELLVLDEPTVGLDPLLRTSIWNHLRNTVNTLGTTIIITTHYIEEARLSDTIGVMRNGALLVEDSPLNLCTNYKCELLEQVVLQICRQSENTKQTSNCKKCTSANNQTVNSIEFKATWNDSVDNCLYVTREEHEMTMGTYHTTLKFDCELSNRNQCTNETNATVGVQSSGKLHHSCQRIYGFTKVLLLTFVRYPAFIGFLLAMPSIQGAITLWAVGPKPKDLGFGIINHELTNWTDECSLPQHFGNSCDLSMLSCKYINMLQADNLFSLQAYTTEEEALNDAHLGRLWGYLSFPYNYTQYTLDRVAANKFALDEAIKGSELHVRLDYSQSIAAYFMIKNLLNAYLKSVKHLVESCDLGGQQAELPLSFRKPVYTDIHDDDFTTFVMPGVIMLFLYSVSFVLSAMLCVTDRKQGTLSRSIAAGLKPSDVIISHLITQGILATCQFLIWSAVINYIFGIPNNGSHCLCLMLCLFIAVAGSGLGVFMGTFCNDEVEALILGVFFVPVFLLFGGVFSPLENMSKFWQGVGSIIPTTLSTLSFRSIVVRGVGLLHPTVWPGVLVLSAWVVVMPMLSVVTFRKTCN